MEGPNVMNSGTPSPLRSPASFHAYDLVDPPACAVTGGTFYDPLIQQFFPEFTGTICSRTAVPGGSACESGRRGHGAVRHRHCQPGGLEGFEQRKPLLPRSRRRGSRVSDRRLPCPTAHPGARRLRRQRRGRHGGNRPATGTWRVRNELEIQFGDVGGISVPGGYDGDGTSDLAVYRPSTGAWWPNLLAVQFEVEGVIPIPGDYNGDGFTDMAVYRPAAGVWYVETGSPSSSASAAIRPVPADYDGDVVTGVAVYRVTTGTCSLPTSSS